MLHLLLVLMTAMSGPMAPAGHRALLSNGGPDAYGYRYSDNDTTGAPEAPHYLWRPEVRASGTEIMGLADDNVVGPFPIGFTFPYYWYTVNSIYVGSNGYITFGDNGLAASPFANLPNSARPNNTVAPLMSDFTFANHPQARAFYWTNPAADTFIVEYDSVPFWEPTGDSGVHTFQIVLSRPDSSLTFMYKTSHGVPYNGWVAGDATVGIENVTGNVGISYLYGNLPARNAIHDTLAIRFWVDSTHYQVHDAAVWRALNEDNGGTFFTRNVPATPWAKVRNTGNQSETNIPVAMLVRNSANSIVYAETLTIPSQAPGQIDSLVFPDWTPTANGRYTTYAMCNLTGDMFHGNDTMRIETRVLTSPADLAYDDGTPSTSMYWNGSSGGFGDVFVAPAYPCTVTVIKAMLTGGTSVVGCTLWLQAADGPNGGPGTVLARKTFNVDTGSTTSKWYADTLTTPVGIASGKFFVGVNSGANNAPSYCMDSAAPISRRGWEYTGSWSPGRDADIQDPMMRATARWQVVTGVKEGDIAPAPAEPMLGASPNPFGSTTRIAFGAKLMTPTKLFVYNATGELVRVMTAAGASTVWDGKNYLGARVAHGIYFAKLMTKKEPVLKVILTN